MQLLGRTSHYSVTSFDSIFFKSSFTFLTSVNSYPFSIFLRHGNLVLSSFRISEMIFSISFSSSCSSSLILKPNSTFSCWLPMSSTTTLTSFKNPSPPFSSKPNNHSSSSPSLHDHVVCLLFFSVFLQGQILLTIASILSDFFGP